MSNPEYAVDYLALGITTDHIPELARMSVDQDLMWADSESDEVWTNIHAWRALGQLRDPAGIPILIEVIRNSEEWDDDWSSTEPGAALALIGEASIEPLRPLLEDAKLNQWTRGGVVEAYEAIAKEHPNLRDRCVAILRQQLANFAPEHFSLNAFIISTLTKLSKHLQPVLWTYRSVVTGKRFKSGLDYCQSARHRHLIGLWQNETD